MPLATGNEGYFAIKFHNSSSTLNGYATISGEQPSEPVRTDSSAKRIAPVFVHIIGLMYGRALSHAALPELNYRQAVQAFGVTGAAELIYLVGLHI
jgi:hypothetical protein